MNIFKNVFGTTGSTGGQNTATNSGILNPAQNVNLSASAYNNAMVATSSIPGSLVSKQQQEHRLSTTNFTVVQAHNGYVITTSNAETYIEDRYIAATVEEVKDLVVSILVQRKIGGV